MPRANRSFVPGLTWHITHRCHESRFLLRFARDRRTYLSWAFEAKKRYGLCLLDYAVTSNHVHLLVKDTGRDAIVRSMQLIAGRTAQEFNLRKNRQGAFWEDRYHATAVETGEHLQRCVVYIDLNMVRAGAVRHPTEWPYCGYREIQFPPQRYALINLAELGNSCGFERVEEFQRAHREWVAAALAHNRPMREAYWSEAVAVGGEAFVCKMKHDLGLRGRSRNIARNEECSLLRDAPAPYRVDFAD
ncbi:MAG: transposase [Burkholderiales bacterium]|nr:transposase [Burkholderiales bacterium]